MASTVMIKQTAKRKHPLARPDTISALFHPKGISAVGGRVDTFATHQPIRSWARSVNICSASASSAREPARIPKASSARRYAPIMIAIQKKRFDDFLASISRRNDAPPSSDRSFLLILTTSTVPRDGATVAIYCSRWIKLFLFCFVFNAIAGLSKGPVRVVPHKLAEGNINNIRNFNAPSLPFQGDKAVNARATGAPAPPYSCI